jgi:16S rRNA (guanine527-N7)-methyltransferase
MTAATVPDFVAPQLAKLDVELAMPQLEQLGRYLDLMLEANAQFNLTGIRDRDACWHRHIIDSLTLMPALEQFTAGAKLIDVGAGAGLPGIPLAIARPDLHVTLLESTGKKARFCQSVCDALGLSHTVVVQDRAETIGRQPEHRQQYDAAVCRAVGPMNQLLELTLPLVKLGGCLLAMKGPSVEAELEAAGDALAILGGGEVQVYDAYPEGFDIRTLIVIVDKDRPTPPPYPRAPGTPKASPL